MKKVLSVVSVALMIVGLVGCMDNPDGSKQTTKSDPAGETKHVSQNN
jgi:PBP1b-binding outer membrane lipoprotein LpoB